MAFLFSSSGGKQSASQGPQFGALRMQSSALGLCLPVVYGVTLVSGNLLDWVNFAAHAQTTTASQGGKGGASVPSQTTWTYSVSWMMGLGEGPWHSFRRILLGKNWGNVAAFDQFLGTYPQTPWSYLTTNFPARALSYPGIAYVAQANADLGQADTLPAIAVEGVALLPWDGSYETASNVLVNLPQETAAQEIWTIATPWTHQVENAATFAYDAGVRFTGSGLPLTRVDGNPGSFPGVEAYTVAPPGTFTVAHAANFVSDEGVFYNSTGLPLTKVAEDPGLGEYTVDGAGNYTFSLGGWVGFPGSWVWVPGDNGAALNIHYFYDDALSSGTYMVSPAGVYTFHADDVDLEVIISYFYGFGSFQVHVGAGGVHSNPGDPPPPTGLWGYLQSSWVIQPTPSPWDPGWDGFKEDLGVHYDQGPALTKVSSNPAQGEYAVDANGAYTFSGHDSNTAMRLSYSYWRFIGANPSEIIPDFLSNPRYGMGFPAENLAALSDFSDYCLAQGLLLSPAYIEQHSGAEILTQMMLATHSEVFESGGLLKVVPYADAAVTGNGVTWTPDLTPLYDLTELDFGVGGTEPVQIIHKSNADGYNSVKIKFRNREKNYDPDVVTAPDLADITANGLREMSVKNCPEITDATTARWLAQIILQYSLHIAKQYQFTLGSKYMLLEPMDIVTLTLNRANLVLDHKPVRIVTVEENENGDLSVLTEEMNLGVASAPKYPPITGTNTGVNQNVFPGSINPPVMFMPPIEFCEVPEEIWVGVSGGENWGGCEIWLSLDGTTYHYQDTIRNPARMGILSEPLAAAYGVPPFYVDETSTLSVDLTMSRGTLIGGTEDDAINLRTLCYVGQWRNTSITPASIWQLLSFANATLTGAYQYNLSYLVRNLYTPYTIQAPAGCNFMCLDNAIYKFKLPDSAANSTIFIKFLSFNQYGLMRQSLEDMEPYEFLVLNKIPPRNIAMKIPVF